MELLHNTQIRVSTVDAVIQQKRNNFQSKLDKEITQSHSILAYFPMRVRNNCGLDRMILLFLTKQFGETHVELLKLILRRKYLPGLVVQEIFSGVINQVLNGMFLEEVIELDTLDRLHTLRSENTTPFSNSNPLMKEVYFLQFFKRNIITDIIVLFKYQGSIVKVYGKLFKAQMKENSLPD